MGKERRTVVYDEDLHLEAYHLEGIVQPFPNHFHEYYVIGFVAEGHRILSCRNREYPIEQGTVIVFNPGDNHACVQNDGGTFDYRGFNIEKTVMLDLAEEVTGKRELPGFSENVIYDGEWDLLQALHEMVMKKEDGFGKEENLLLLISTLMQKYGQSFADCIPECRQEIDQVCNYIEQHFSQNISLEQLCHDAGLSKSTLLRAFTRSKGITPYRYLETIRINEAKRLLAKGVSPAETAMQTGFSDQSHFTNCFSRFIGLSPGRYQEIFTGRQKVGKKAIRINADAEMRKK